MMIFPDYLTDIWIDEDINGIDLTTYLTDFSKDKLDITFTARHDMTLSASEAAVKILKKTGCTVTEYVPSGTSVKQGDVLITAEGSPEAVHAGWRISLNLMEYSSGIATRTASLVKAARAVNPSIVVSGTRNPGSPLDTN